MGSAGFGFLEFEAERRCRFRVAVDEGAPVPASSSPALRLEPQGPTALRWSSSQARLPTLPREPRRRPEGQGGHCPHTPCLLRERDVGPTSLPGPSPPLSGAAGGAASPCPSSSSCLSVPSQQGRPKAPPARPPATRPQRPAETKAHLPPPGPQRPAGDQGPPASTRAPAASRDQGPPVHPAQRPAETKAHLQPPWPSGQQRLRPTCRHLGPSGQQRPRPTCRHPAPAASRDQVP
ncbi:hypothetical protein AAY473_005119 [Plecturocebus cupreus]